jgi:hypothetical protein
MTEQPTKPHPVSYRILIRNFLIELGVYGGLMTVYYLIALRLLSTPLRDLFLDNLILYAVAALVLIVVQGVLLESLTSYLLERLGLQRFE